MHPLEHRRLARESAVDIAARQAERRRSVGLHGRRDFLRAAREQSGPVHLEEAAGIVIDVDELAAIDVEHHDHFRRMLDQRPVARLALAHGLLGEMPLGDVADADDVAVAPVERRLAHGDLQSDPRPVLGQTPGMMRREIDMGVVDLGGTVLEKLDGTAGRESPAAGSSRCGRNLGEGVAEYPLAGRIARLDVAAFIDRDDCILDVVENGLQVRGGLLADLAGQRLRLVRHELHGAHDPAALRVDAVVVRRSRSSGARAHRARRRAPRASAICRSSSG